MLNKKNFLKMRGRNDASRRRRLIGSLCVVLVISLLFFTCYAFLFSSRLRRSRQSTPIDEEGWHGEWFARRFGNIGKKIEKNGSERTKDLLTLNHGRDANTKFLELAKTRTDKVRLDVEDSEDDNGGDIRMQGVEHNSTDDPIEGIPIKSFLVCDALYSELIPCLDRRLHAQLKLKLNLTIMEHYERHCPPTQRRLNCLIPQPPNYKVPIRWPASRDEVWQSNVPHTFLALEKSDQHWMAINGSKVNFPGGGTHFHDGAEKYIAALAKMLHFPHAHLSNHGRIRTVLDVGCGVASFGAYLLPLGILTMSIAPNDVHENQIQFALERGIPSTLGVLATMRLPYPSKSFDLAHCSRCRIDWLQRDGVLLLEVDRLLRPGGYFAWSSPPAYRDDEEDVQIWNAMSSLVGHMCWSIAAKEGQSVIWMKPLTNDCYKNRAAGTKPPLCSKEDDPDAAWQVPMKACISSLSEYNDRVQGSGLAPFPKRLTTPPWRLQDLSVSNKSFHIDKVAWRARVNFYWKQLSLEIDNGTFRNIMDMKAHFGGFAAALKDRDVWVMNVVPNTGLNTLKVIYDRGLIGTLHDWCEAFSTYPRTFDLLHAWTLFTDIDSRSCSMEDLLLEMDRILRPMGFVIIRDKACLVDKIVKYLMALHWDAWSLVVEPGPDSISNGGEKVLMARKQLLKLEDAL